MSIEPGIAEQLEEQRRLRLAQSAQEKIAAGKGVSLVETRAVGKLEAK